MIDMKPGPELDALVAERVMGWEARQGVLGCEVPPRGVPLGMGGWPTWSPSTDIAAAWEVVEKLRGPESNWNPSSPTHGDGPRGQCLKILIDPMDFGGVWYWAGPDDERFVLAKHGIPHAICLAALKAVEG